MVVYHLNDVTRISSEDDAVDLIDEVEKQFQNSAIIPSITTETEFESEAKSSIEATLATELVDITDQTTRDSPTRI